MNFKDGDVFRWNWTDAQRKRRQEEINAGTLYWCMSQIAIYSEGRRALVDTYWYMSSENKVVDPDKVELTYLGNIHDYELATPNQAKYYNSSDILDLRHANNSRDFYLRKGAERCEDTIREGIKRKIESLRNDISFKENEVERLQETLRDDLGDALY